MSSDPPVPSGQPDSSTPSTVLTRQLLTQPPRALQCLRGLGLLASLALCPASLSAQSATHPNILFISVDDLNDWAGVMGGASHVLEDPVLGSRLTPNIDRLASQSVTFVNAQTSSPACTPSRAALMTGISPATSGLVLNPTGTHFRSFEALRYAVSLPQHLKAPEPGPALYSIELSGKMFHTNFKDTRKEVRALFGDDAAFTSWDATPSNLGRAIPAGVAIDGERFVPHPWALGSIKWARQIPTFRGRDVVDPALLDLYTDAGTDLQRALWGASRVRNDRPGGQPKFIAVGIFRPHLPWEVPVHFFDRFPLDQISIPNVAPDDTLDLPVDSLAVGDRGIHPKMLDHRTDRDYPGQDQVAWRLAIQAYMASIAYADYAVGKMVREIEIKNGDSDPTNDWTVVLWSDHGWHLGEKDRWKKFTLWHESARSLLMVWQPGLSVPGSLVDVPVDFLDVYPTICDLAGVAPPEQLQGRSFVDLLIDPQARSDNPAFTTWGEGRHSVRTRRWRYIRYPQAGEELYDRFNDSEEHFNLLHPVNDTKLEVFGLSIDFIEQVRLAHSTELFRWSTKVRNRAVFDRQPLFELEEIETRGRRVIDRFEGTGTLAQRAWQPRPSSVSPTPEWQIRGGSVRTTAGERVHYTRDQLELGAGEDFLASVSVELSRRAAGLGLLFGYVAENEFLEFQLVNQKAPGTGGALDARLIRHVDGIETTLVAFESMRRLDEPSADPLDFGRGPYTLVADYTAVTRELELLVQNALGVNVLRRVIRLDEALPASSSFGVASWSADEQSRFDDFIVLTTPPFSTLGAAIEPVDPTLTLIESAGEAALRFRRSGSSSERLSISYSTRSSTAWRDRDYEHASGTLVWESGDTSEREIRLTLIDDQIIEEDETLILSFEGDGTTVEPRALKVTIVDDDLLPDTCSENTSTLCLGAGRFAVQAEWRSASAAGACHWIALTDETGYCWFFDSDNVEIAAKVLNACSGFDSFWFFATGLTNLETRLIVIDTQSKEVNLYTSSLNEPFPTIADTSAFSDCRGSR